MKNEQPNSWLHPLDCRCARCMPPAPRTSDQLTATQISLLCGGGILVGNGIAFVYDPHAVLTALAATIGIVL